MNVTVYSYSTVTVFESVNQGEKCSLNTPEIVRGNNFFTYCVCIAVKCRPPSLSELTPMVFNTGLTHLGSEK